MQGLRNRLEKLMETAIDEQRAVRMGNPDFRRTAVYHFGTWVRNFTGELAMKVTAPGEPEQEIVANNQRVKRAAGQALLALNALATEILKSEDAVDITPKVRGALASEAVEATIQRAIRETLGEEVER